MKNPGRLLFSYLAIFIFVLVGCETPGTNKSSPAAPTKLTPGMMGVNTCNPSGMAEPKGALVIRVKADSSAEKAGIQEGDIIIEFNGRPIHEYTDLHHLVTETAAGTMASVKVLRDGKEKTFNVTLSEYTEEEPKRDLEDCLHLVRKTPIDAILAGWNTWDFIPCSDQDRESIELAFNNVLIEWKAKGLLECLKKSSPTQINDLRITLEKGILRLDLVEKKAKDLGDEFSSKATPDYDKIARLELTWAHLLEQRKTILMAILGFVKQAAAQRASGR